MEVTANERRLSFGGKGTNKPSEMVYTFLQVKTSELQQIKKEI